MGMFGSALTLVGMVLAIIIGWKLFKHIIGIVVLAVALLLVLWFTGIVNL